MTWAKYSTEFSDECADANLTDAAYRTHSEAISWLYRIEPSKLRIPKKLIRRFAGSDDYELAVKELTDAGFWRDLGDAWEIVHHGGVIRQSLAAQQQKRDRDKRAQAARRKRVTGGQEDPEVIADVSADISDDVGTESVAAQTTNQTSLHRRTTYPRRTA